MNNHEKEISGKIMQFLTANWINQPLYVAVKLGIPDILADGPRSISEISRLTESHEQNLYRIMRALASLGFFHEEENRIFVITPMGTILQKDKMRPIVLMFLSDWHSKAWAQLYHSVKTGDIAFESAYGKPCFEWLADNKEAADEFNKANEIKAIKGNAEIANAYDFSEIKSITDIGGGYGGLLYCILQKDKHVNGIVADLSYLKEKVEKKIADNNLNRRCVFKECDFFKEIPGDTDCYILSNILHDWDDSKCRIILDNCHNAIPPDSKLLIIESILPERNEFSIASLLDLEVLVMGGGKERTEAEFRVLLYNSGFILSRIIRTEENVSIFECVRE